MENSLPSVASRSYWQGLPHGSPASVLWTTQNTFYDLSVIEGIDHAPPEMLLIRFPRLGLRLFTFSPPHAPLTSYGFTMCMV